MNEDESKAVEIELLSSLANANANNINSKKVYDEITDISKEISELSLKLSNITEGYVNKHNKNVRDYKWDTDEIESGIKKIRKKFESLEEERSIFIEKLLIILGTIYEGTLIDNEISFRNGKIYRFRCRYTLSLKDVLDIMVRHKDEVVEKLKPQYQKTLVYIYNQYAKLKSFCSVDDLKNVSIKIKIDKIDFIEPRLMDGRLDIYKVDNIILDGHGICFYYGEDKQDFNNTTRVLFEKVYTEQIEDAVKELLKNISVEHDKTRVMLEDVRVNYAKQLVYAELLAKKQDGNY